MIGGPKVGAENSSVAVGGDNAGVIVNAGALNLNFSPETAAKLPSFLAKIITFFSQENLAEYDEGARRELPPDVTIKIAYNNLSPAHQVIVDYLSYSLLLAKVYHGVEQQNADAQRLVRRKAASVYRSQLQAACTAASIANEHQSLFATKHAAALIENVTEQLLKHYMQSNTMLVESETAELAISLIIADAIIECDVLERPLDATSA